MVAKLTAHSVKIVLEIIVQQFAVSLMCEGDEDDVRGKADS